MSVKTLGIPNYRYITNSDEAKRVVSELESKPYLSVDTETTGLDPYTSRVTLTQIGDGNDNYVFDTRYYREFSDIHPSVFNPLWENENIVKILQNALFDMKMLKVHGGVYLKNVFDTMLAEQILTLGLPKAKASLAALMEKYLNLNMPKEPRKTFSDDTQPFKPYQLEYAANDVVPLQLIMDLQKSFLAVEGLNHVASLEFDFLKPLCEMELNGVSIDQNKWSIIMDDIEKEAVRLEQELNSILSATSDQATLFGASTININSQPQLLKALRKYGLEDLESTDVSVLKGYAGLPVIDKLLDYRKYKKLCSTYGQTLLDKINPATNRLHTAFKQLISTGRLSSANPNLQNIPNKQLYRTGFVAEEGYSLLTADQSSAELRILANLSKDPMFLKAYKEGLDLHTMTASAAFSIPYDEVTSEQRKKAKPLNFGLCVFEDTNLITDNGIVTIKDCGVDSKTAHDLGSDEIIDKKYMGKKEVFEVKTKFGYTMEVTKDHLVKIIDMHGNYIEKKIKDIDKSTDYMCLKKGSNLFNNKYFEFDEFTIEKNTSYIDFELPKILDEDWAYFLGLFVSEGHLHKSNGFYNSIQFVISSKEQDFVYKLDSLFYKLFGRFSRVESEDMVKYSINSVKIARWLYTLFNFDNGDKTNSICIPNCIKLSPMKVQINFISSLFEGDGTIWKEGNVSKIKYDSKSKNLLKDLQIMLLNFGIITSLRKNKDKRYPNEKYYSLNIVGYKCRKLFKDKISFWTDYKNSKWIEQTFNKSLYELPCSKEYVLNVRRLLQAKDNRNKDDFNTIRYLYNKANISPTCGIGDFYFDKLAEYDDNINFINENGIVPLPIQSIESKGVKKVYDISVKNQPYFLADGFIVHNCYGLSKFGLARQLGISDNEAEKMIDNFFEQYKEVKETLDESAKSAIDNGYTKSISGRKRYYELPPFYDPDFKRISKSVQRRGKNMPIQASDADTIKKSMIYLVDRLEKSGLDARLVLTVHDEVVVEARSDQADEVAPIVRDSLIDGFGYYFDTVPMEVDVLTGPCWLKEACETKDENGIECKGTTMKFTDDEKLGTKLVCAKCGGAMQ